MKYSPKIFVSYLFSKSAQLEEEIGNKFLQKITKSFSDKNYELIFDQVNMMSGGNINQFVENMPLEKFIIIVLNEHYLYSDSCLYELYYLFSINFPFYKIILILIGDVKCIDNLDFIDYEYYFGDSLSYLKEKEEKAKNLYLKGKFLQEYNFIKDVQKFLLNLCTFSKLIKLSRDSNIDKIISEIKTFIVSEFIQEKDFLIKISKPNYLNRCPYYVPKNLIGREAELKNLSIEIEKYQLMYLESGIPGIGKTTLAKAFINEEKFYDRFDNIAWVTVSNSILENFVDQLYRSSQLENYKTEQDLSTNFKLLFKQLNKIEGNNLLIIDNANNHDDLYDFIQKIKHLNWRFLFIGQVAPNYLHATQLYTISQKSSIELFYKHYKKEKNDRILSFLLKLIKNHTFIIELLAKVANNNSKFNILKLYEIIRKAKMRPPFIVPIKEYKKNVTEENIIEEKELYKFIVEIFELENFSEEEISILRYFTVLPPYEMSENKLIKFFGINDINKPIFNSTLNNLLKKGWLHNNHDTYSIHVLIQPVLFKLLSPKSEHCKPLITFFIKNTENLDELNTIHKKSYLPYAESIVYSLYDNSEILIKLAENLAEFYYKLENYQFCLDFYLVAAQMKEILFKDNLEILAECYNKISILHGKLGNFENDLNFAFKTLKIREQIYDKEDLKLAEIYNNIAITYRNINNYKTALKYHLKDLNICEKKLDKNDNLLANSYFEISLTYYYLKQYTESKKYIDKALAIWQQNLPSNCTDIRNAIEIQEIIHRKVK